MVNLRSKIVVVGDYTVGKSALIQMFHTNGTNYPKNYVMTVGVDFCVKLVNIPETQHPASVELHIFDSAGQNVFRDLTPQYWEGASMVMLCYDVTNAESFANLQKWLKMCQDQLRTDQIRGVVVANKVDLEERAVVSSQQGKEFAMNAGMTFFECSALKQVNVDAPFNYLAGLIYRQYEENLDVLLNIANNN